MVVKSFIGLAPGVGSNLQYPGLRVATSIANIILGLNFLTATNTLAYWSGAQATKKKKFYDIDARPRP
jgi:hypothetical protein